VGKPSKLAERKNQSRQLYDRDKMPDGLDPEIWHLTLYFEQEAERYQANTIGRPIIYTELSNRINASSVRQNFIHWSGIVEDMITRFWAYELDPGKNQYAINEFCGADTFSYLMKWVVDERARQLLIDSGDRIVQPDAQIQESRRTPEETAASEIINRRYTEEELRDRIRRFSECRQRVSF